ncbi:MAG: peptide-methionine (R)-S-oxide reductase MsrB [Gammaproteobacteria bacterium]|nr:peptide-methionine (R)-S-oxide reductase MsrB [Gammaproteobacteria bacterium]
MQKIQKTDDEWRKVLSNEQFRVARKGGTERAFSGQYYDNKDGGVYRCICCNTELFQSTEKYDSGSGWPSFWQPVSDDVIEQLVDNSHGMQRVEVRCGQCEAHLGHVFTDGPQPTGQRYCINSASLDFEPKDIE